MSSESSIRDHRVQTVCLMVISAVLLMYAIERLSTILVPLVVALFVVSGISPILALLQNKLRVHRLVAAAITFVIGLVLMLGLGVCVWFSVQQLAENGESYRERITEITEHSRNWINQYFPEDEAEPSKDDLENSNGTSGGEISNENTNSTELNEKSSAQHEFEQMTEDLKVTVSDWVKQTIGTLSAALLSFLSTSMIVLIYVFFLLMGKPRVDDQESTFGKIDMQVRSYLSMKTIISAGTGLVFGLALWMLGVPMALTFGLMAFLLNYIPNFGPIIASILPIPFILLAPDATWLWISFAILVVVAIQNISGNVVEPKLMGNSSDLHPVTVLLGLMFWGLFWGIIGMFLATPITAAVKIILEKFDSTRKIAHIMAGRFENASRN